VFAGMLGVTFFGLFLTPVFYVLLRTLALRLGKPVIHGVPVKGHGAELEGATK
jgi:multidrug efflux pump